MSSGRADRTLVAMTTTEYALNIALVGLVLLQIRGVTITKAALLFPVVMTTWIATSLLTAIPTAGNDLVLEVGGALAGATLGTLAGLATGVTRQGATAIAKAGAVAAVLWVAGIGARVGFSLWVGHGGAPTVRRFSIAPHHRRPRVGDGVHRDGDHRGRYPYRRHLRQDPAYRCHDRAGRADPPLRDQLSAVGR